ncbi:MAG: TetR/AcrR family transcriptional regulator [Chloroflexaceae bacterium]|nr:TetR/AcrR family transcriptional regulator [Chloroflexaceae bacterium]
MSVRAGLTTESIVQAAIALIDEQGPESLSLASLASTFGVRSPSLYNHINGLDGLRHRLVLAGLRALSEAIRASAVGRSGFEALHAMCHAYRAFARQHPGLYTMTLRSQEQGDPELQQAGRATVDVVLATLQAYNLPGDAALHAVRYVRSVLHGFVLLEVGGGFGLPLELDTSFERMITALDYGLRMSQQPAHEGATQ